MKLQIYIVTFHLDLTVTKPAAVPSVLLVGLCIGGFKVYKPFVPPCCLTVPMTVQQLLVAGALVPGTDGIENLRTLL